MPGAVTLAALVVALRRRRAAAMELEPASAEAAPKSVLELPESSYGQYYASLIHQQNMLQDAVRTAAYHDAIVFNASDFLDKVVLDVGTGSGILAYFAVKAGARKVYAVEASDVADRAKILMQAAGLSDRVIVVKCKVEHLQLDEKVDVIISEPMGFALIHERMLESYMIARERFLKPGGLMMPTTGTLHVAPFSDAALYLEQQTKAAFWNTSDFYGLDLRSMHEYALKDHFQQPVVGYVDPGALLATTTSQMTIDFSRDAPASLHVMELPLSFVASRTGICHGIAAWFDVTFKGSTVVAVLPTGPSSPGTHWYQCRLLVRTPLAVNAGQRITGVLRMVANERWSYNLSLSLTLPGSEHTSADGAPVQASAKAGLQDQLYYYMSAAATTA